MDKSPGVTTIPQKMDESFVRVLEHAIHSISPAFPIKSKKAVIECATQWLLEDWNQITKERDEKKQQRMLESFNEKIFKTIEKLQKDGLMPYDSRGIAHE